MNIHRVLIMLSLALFLVTVIVEYADPQIACTWPWHPLSCEWMLAHNWCFLPALPTWLAFLTLVIGAVKR
jgi:hypothetical protein